MKETEASKMGGAITRLICFAFQLFPVFFFTFFAIKTKSVLFIIGLALLNILHIISSYGGKE